MQTACLCYCFTPSLSCLCAPLSPHCPTSPHLPQYLISPPRLPASRPPVTPSLSSGSAGVHMIKRGAQVITWRCQIKRPLIQMRSEISKRAVALAATTHPRRRRRGDLRAPGRGAGPAGRQQQHSPLPLSPLQNISAGVNGAKHAQVHQSVFIWIT